MIPKIIHYCWLSNDPVPSDLQKYMESWKVQLPDYEFIKWDFSKFNKESSVWVSEAYDNKKYAFACDYIRLFALYNYGGIYMDMDIEVLRPFDDLLQHKYMIAKERPDQMWIEAGCFGSEKGNPFLEKCLEYYKDKHFVNDNGGIEDTPLPRIMAKIYSDNGYDFKLYDWHTFTNKSYTTGEINIEENSYAIHHFAGSWKSKEEQEVIKKAKKIRNEIVFVGPMLAFVYEKSYKCKEALKKGGIKELKTRISRFINKA